MTLPLLARRIALTDPMTDPAPRLPIPSPVSFMLRTASVTLVASSLVIIFIAAPLFGQADPGPFVPILPAVGAPQAAQPSPSPTTVVAIMSVIAGVFTSLSAFLGPIIKDAWGYARERLHERRKVILIRTRIEDLMAYSRMAKSRYPDLPEPPVPPADVFADLDDEGKPK